MSRKEQIKELLTFTKGEQNGILVLIIIMIIVILINIFSDSFIERKDYNFSDFEKEIEEFEKGLIPIEDNSSKTSYYDNKYDTLKLFSFNPNNTSNKEWVLLGLSDKQIKTINNWQSKGGKFKYKSDLKRIYGIFDTQYNILSPYIVLPEKDFFSDKENFYKNTVRNSNYDTEKKIPDVEEYFKFNPNKTSNEDWQLLGFSQKQITTIKNYVNKGGKFYKKEDLKKIYGIKDFQYERIKDYIELTDKKDKSENQRKIRQKVDINNLSSEEFIELGGFWKYNGVRIVKYRNILGGYYNKEQLLEVYGIKKQYYDKVAEYIIIDKQKIEKIHINFAETSELGRHPYISYKNAKIILDYRNKNGAFKQLSELINKNIISKSLYEKISPYLKVK